MRRAHRLDLIDFMENCQWQDGILRSLGDVREEIDRLDDDLVELLAKQLHAIRRASELKAEPSDALVEWRVEEVARRVRSKARAVGFDPDVAERIWRGMMEECIAFERDAINRGGPARAGAAAGYASRTKVTPRAPKKHPATEHLPMKLSARNQIKGTIKSVRKGQTTAHVEIDTNGTTITASITNEAVDALALKQGQAAYAVIKASDVMVAVD